VEVSSGLEKHFIINEKISQEKEECIGFWRIEIKYSSHRENCYFIIETGLL